MRFKNEHAYVYAKVVVPALILGLWIILALVNTLIVYNTKAAWMSRACSRNILVCTVALLAIGAACLFIPIPNRWFVRRQVLEEHLPLFAQGFNSRLYEEHGRLWKVIQTLPTHHSLGIESRCCNRDKDRTCTIPLIVFRRLHVSLIALSWSRILKLQKAGDEIAKFFPHIYHLDAKQGVMLFDKIETRVGSMQNYGEQIHELDRNLRRVGLVLEDVDDDNVMVDTNGQLRIVDFDYVLTPKESEWLRSFVATFATDVSARGVLGATRVMQPMYAKPSVAWRADMVRSFGTNRPPPNSQLTGQEHVVEVNALDSGQVGRLMRRVTDELVTTGKLVRSQTVGGLSEHRTSRSSFLTYTCEESRHLRRLAAQMFNVPETHCEPTLHVAEYQGTQKYDPHQDSCCDSSNACVSFRSAWGDRIGTLLVYLTDGFTGGYTIFPNLNLKLRPTPGQGLVWKTASCPDWALHGGAPVVEGTKVIATVWVRERPAS